MACALIALTGIAGTATAKQPALAAGTSSDVRAAWRLEGRTLTVRLRDPLTEVGGRGQRVMLRCGDSAVRPRPGLDYVEAFADAPGNAWTRVAKRTRQLRVRLSRDVAARANLCTAAFPAATDTNPDALRVDALAQMTARRGGAGCTPARREQTVHRGERVLVTRSDLFDGEGWAYRACVRGGGAPQPLADVYSVGGGGGVSELLGPFVSNGAWLAWGDRVVPHGGSGHTTRVIVQDMAPDGASRPGRRTRFGYRNDGYIGGLTVPQLVLAADGAVAFTLQTRAAGLFDGPIPTETRVEAGRPGGTASTLDRVDADAISALAISPDGTITWARDGLQRSARLP